jgi:cytochrome oxidase Cu insertion factor (SCO1/SenC/PrrC family)
MFRVLIAVAIFMAAVPVLAHHERDDGVAAPASKSSMDSVVTLSPKQRAARIFFSDRRLLNQRGDEVAFYSDVLRDKVVLINFIYTQCTDACPTQTARLAQVQSLLGDRVGRDVALVSISVDPEHDTPQVLREYATRFGAKEGWVFLTGSSTDVNDVLRRLGQLASSREEHTTLFIVGNVATGHWMKVHPDAAPSEIARLVRSLAQEAVAALPTAATASR